jgi:hypothetical protein
MRSFRLGNGETASLIRLGPAVIYANALGKRTHVSSRTPLRIFVGDDELVIAITAVGKRRDIWA